MYTEQKLYCSACTICNFFIVQSSGRLHPDQVWSIDGFKLATYGLLDGILSISTCVVHSYIAFSECCLLTDGYLKAPTPDNPTPLQQWAIVQDVVYHSIARTLAVDCRSNSVSHICNKHTYMYKYVQYQVLHGVYIYAIRISHVCAYQYSKNHIIK